MLAIFSMMPSPCWNTYAQRSSLTGSSGSFLTKPPIGKSFGDKCPSLRSLDCFYWLEKSRIIVLSSYQSISLIPFFNILWLTISCDNVIFAAAMPLKALLDSGICIHFNAPQYWIDVHWCQNWRILPEIHTLPGTLLVNRRAWPATSSKKWPITPVAGTL